MSYNKYNIATIDIGSKNTSCVIATKDMSNNINILGIGTVVSNGISHGKIANVLLAQTCIKNALTKAKEDSMVNRIDHCVVSINSVYLKYFKSKASANIPNSTPSVADITSLLKASASNLTLNNDYKIVQVIPIYFKVDGEDYIQDPLRAVCTRLEVSVCVVVIKENELAVIRKCLGSLGIMNKVSFVSSAYASSLGVVDTKHYKRSNIVINIGYDTTQIAITKGESLMRVEHIPLGSNNITKDLAISLKTPTNAANMLKEEYGTLTSKFQNHKEITKIKLPIVGNETQYREISLGMIMPIVHARVEEILYLVKDKLEHSGFSELVYNNNVFLTGGMSNLKGIYQLSANIFSDLNVQKDKTKIIHNSHIDTSSRILSVCIGLVLYQLDGSIMVQINSNGEVIDKFDNHSATDQNTIHQNNSSNIVAQSPEMELKNIQQNLENNKMQNKPSGLFKKLGEWL